jgi:hypothetical protein
MPHILGLCRIYISDQIRNKKAEIIFFNSPEAVNCWPVKNKTHAKKFYADRWAVIVCFCDRPAQAARKLSLEKIKKRLGSRSDRKP